MPKKARRVNSKEAKDIARNTESGVWGLLPSEVWWRDHHDVLKAQGYSLRPRYSPTWKPSWLGAKLDPDTCEDAIAMAHPEIVDAVRVSDGTKVVIKRSSIETKEIDILQHLTTPDKLQDPRNHCVPLLDVLNDPSDPELRFIVMPLLLSFDRIEFYTVAEILDCIDQTLEGLSFVHDQGVAHRDCAAGNLMMIGDVLAPRGFHPANSQREPSGAGPARIRQRSDDPSLRYLFIDFGISSWFPDPTESRLVLGLNGQDTSAPELSDLQPYDPFPLDLYILGDVYLLRFYHRFQNVDFLKPLIDSMINDNPKERPTASEALAQFRALSSAWKAERHYRWRAQSRLEGPIEVVYRDALAYCHSALTSLQSNVKSIIRTRRKQHDTAKATAAVPVAP